MPKRVEFRWVTLAEARAAGADDLTALHWEEIEHHKDAAPLDIDWASYRDMERNGRLKIGSVWSGGAMIGYNAFFVWKPLHHRSTLWAVSDVIYLDPAHRQGWAGVKLIKEAERGLKAMGVRIVLYSVKPDRNLKRSRVRDSISLLLQRLGYGAFEVSWTKVL